MRFKTSKYQLEISFSDCHKKFVCDQLITAAILK